MKRVARKSTAPKQPLRVPREHIEWITEARSEATRTRRLETTIDWLSQGKPRNWKYMKR